MHLNSKYLKVALINLGSQLMKFPNYLLFFLLNDFLKIINKRSTVIKPETRLITAAVPKKIIPDNKKDSPWNSCHLMNPDHKNADIFFVFIFQ